jgi:hypothetical protein
VHCLTAGCQSFINIFKGKKSAGWWGNSVVDCLPTVLKALVQSPASQKKKKEREKVCKNEGTQIFLLK